jgi:hypothetical protein
MGCKGIFFFQLVPIMTSEAGTEKIKTPDVEWKDVLLKKNIDAGPGGLTNPDGTVTPQFQELGRFYKQIAPYRSQILRWQKTAADGIEIKNNNSIDLTIFLDSSTKLKYAVIVNSNLAQSKSFEITIPSKFKRVLDLMNQRVVTTSSKTGSTVSFTLNAGEGTILEINDR